MRCDLVEIGLRSWMHLFAVDLYVVDRVTGETVMQKVQLFLCGDMLFQCEICGHQGCASTHPCLK